MDDMENKLGAILGNPEMMEKIMSLAQNFSQSQTQEPSAPKQEASSPKPDIGASGLPELDLSTIQRLSGLARQSGIDKNQQNLLRALGPYISSQRISKLERAMRAAKMAGMATAFLGKSGR